MFDKKIYQCDKRDGKYRNTELTKTVIARFLVLSKLSFVDTVDKSVFATMKGGC